MPRCTLPCTKYTYIMEINGGFFLIHSMSTRYKKACCFTCPNGVGEYSYLNTGFKAKGMTELLEVWALGYEQY